MLAVMSGRAWRDPPGAAGRRERPRRPGHRAGRRRRQRSRIAAGVSLARRSTRVANSPSGKMLSDVSRTQMSPSSRSAVAAMKRASTSSSGPRTCRMPCARNVSASRSSLVSSEVATMVSIPSRAARRAASTTTGNPQTGSSTLPGRRDEDVRACRMTRRRAPELMKCGRDLPRGPAAIDRQVGAGDEARRGTRQEDGGASQILRLSQPSHRHLLGQGGGKGGIALLRGFRRECAGADGVDPDSVRRQMARRRSACTAAARPWRRRSAAGCSCRSGRRSAGPGLTMPYIEEMLMTEASPFCPRPPCAAGRARH